MTTKPAIRNAMMNAKMGMSMADLLANAADEQKKIDRMPKGVAILIGFICWILLAARKLGGLGVIVLSAFALFGILDWFPVSVSAGVFLLGIAGLLLIKPLAVKATDRLKSL